VRGGSLSPYSRQTGTVKEGSYALECDLSSTPGEHIISSTSGLNRYPTEDETFKVNAYSANGDDLAIGFFAQNENYRQNWSGYVVQANIHGTANRIVRIDNGTYNIISAASVSIPSNEWLEFEVTKVSSTDEITYTLYDESGSEIDTRTATDSTYSSGGIAWWIIDRNSGTNYYDNFRVA